LDAIYEELAIEVDPELVVAAKRRTSGWLSACLVDIQANENRKIGTFRSSPVLSGFAVDCYTWIEEMAGSGHYAREVGMMGEMGGVKVTTVVIRNPVT